MSNWKIINAPLFLTATAEGLLAAINTAPAGAVITVEEAGDPLLLNLTRDISGYGVVIMLPMDQVVHVIVNGGAGGYHFYGGRWSADEVFGTTTETNNGIRMLPGSSRISVHGAAFDNNQNSVQGSEVSDVWLRGIRMDVNRADNINLVSSQRVAIEGVTAGPGARGEKFCYFSDGRAPSEGIGSGPCAAAGGEWEDTSHNDALQARNECTDILVADGTFAGYQSQGLTSFGSGGADDPGSRIERAALLRNTIQNSAAWGIWLAGADIDIRDNVVTSAPDAATPARILAHRQGDGRISGGRNTAPGFINPAGVDLASSTINGDDGVVPPERPRIILPPWAPEVPIPPVPAIAAPRYIAGGGIRHHGTLAAGTWLSLNRGQYTDVAGVTWEYRWRLNGDLIGGETAQMMQAVSGTIVAECRGQNAEGWGEWHAYEAVVVV